MRLAVWRFVTLVLVAPSMGLSMCHLFELSARLSWEPAFWMAVTNPPNLLYRNFGTVGAVVDVAAWISAVVLAFLVRRRPGFRWAALGAALMVVAHAGWWSFVFPMNLAMADWRAGSVPASFFAVRDQWEYAHAAIAILKLLGLAALVASVLAETPREHATVAAGAPARRPLT